MSSSNPSILSGILKSILETEASKVNWTAADLLWITQHTVFAVIDRHKHTGGVLFGISPFPNYKHSLENSLKSL